MILMVAVGLVGLVSALVPGPGGLPHQVVAQPEARLNSRIPAADRARYIRVRDARDWRNPYLVASASGFEIKSISSPVPRLLPLKDLRRVLTGLPISDWPYGRVVVVQSPSIAPADSAWREAMTRNIEGAVDILKALGVDAWGWPP
jgi:hypothetical protein